MRSSSAARSRTVDDAELVRLAQTGQGSAFGELVLRHQDRLFNAVWRICGNLEDARDVTQDAFVKTYENLGAFRQHSAFYTWLFRVAVNLALSLKRSGKRKRTTSLDAAITAAGSQADTLAARFRRTRAPMPEESDKETAIQGNVVKALLELSDDDRAVIVLRDMEGFDYQQIAEILDIPLGTVRSRLHRARAAIRDRVLPLFQENIDRPRDSDANSK